MSEAENLTRRVRRVHESLGESLDAFGGFLRCESCRVVRLMNPGDAGYYTSQGWPKCCGHSMRWWTKRQVEASEVTP